MVHGLVIRVQLLLFPYCFPIQMQSHKPTHLLLSTSMTELILVTEAVPGSLHRGVHMHAQSM